MEITEIHLQIKKTLKIWYHVHYSWNLYFGEITDWSWSKFPNLLFYPRIVVM